MAGPLAGVKIVELAGIGAAPYGCMMLADLGAEVVRVDRRGGPPDPADQSPLLRNRRSLALDLKRPEGRDTVLALVERADVLVEAYRPGVAERLGLGPDACLALNPRLVYARMTGWGQDGPLARQAGHDLNYIALAGLLHQIGPSGGKPVVPLNVIGDFGGGGLLMAYGIVCALFETSRSGQGQVIDAAMVDGAVSFMAMSYGFRALGLFDDRTGSHVLGGGAPFYEVYECADGRHLAVAAIEPQFYAILIERLGLAAERWLPAGYAGIGRAEIQRQWPAFKAELAAIFRSRPRDEWVALFAGTDACVSPVLSLAEAELQPHNRARAAHVTVGGVVQNAPAPRFSRTPADAPQPPPRPGSDTDAVLADWCVDPLLVARARSAGALD
jgi:alpha-methylacyl-CoA racemase